MSSSMPKKIGENQYQIDADPNLGMKVPVKIYADEPLLQKMLSDRTIMQARNFPKTISFKCTGEESSRRKDFDFFSSAKLRMVMMGIISSNTTAIFWKLGSMTISLIFRPMPIC